MESWIATVPLVSAFAAVFTAGVAWQRLRSQNERIGELETRLTKTCESSTKTLQHTLDRDVARLQKEHERSSAAQGTRLGKIESLLDSLDKWRAEIRGAERERHRTSAGGMPTIDDT